jgi:hypothetical protein
MRLRIITDLPRAIDHVRAQGGHVVPLAGAGILSLSSGSMMTHASSRIIGQTLVNWIAHPGRVPAFIRVRPAISLPGRRAWCAVGKA